MGPNAVVVTASVAQALQRLWIRRDRETMHALTTALDLPGVVRLAYDEPPDRLRHRASEAVASRRHHLQAGGRTRDLDAGVAEAVTAMGLYFIALQAWENTDDYDAIEHYVDAVRDWLAAPDADRAAPDGPAPSDPAPDDPVTTSVHGLLASLAPQMATEDARFCACPLSMQVAADQSVEALAQVEALGPWAGQDQVPALQPTGNASIDLLLELLAQDRTNDLVYYTMLGRDIAPLATTYAEQLVAPPTPDGTDSTMGWRADLESAIDERLPRLRAQAQDFLERGEVFGGELRAQCDALDSMRDSLARDALVLDTGRLVMVYPFAMDLAHDWSGDVDNGVDLPSLVMDDGTAITVEVATFDRTDAWAMLTGANVDMTDVGALRLAAGQSLRLRPSWALKSDLPHHHDLHLQIILGAGAKHYVRVETAIGLLEGPRMEGVTLDGTRAWSGHEVDQWVRRLTRDAGTEQVEVVRDGEVVASHGCIHDLNLELLRALRELDAQRAGTATSAVTDVDLERGLTQSSIVFVVETARVVTAAGTHRPLTSDDDLQALNGFQSLVTRSRYLPAAVEEWVGFEVPDIPDLLAGMGHRGDTLFAAGEVFALFARSSPNWIVIEQLEMLEFAISVNAEVATLSSRLTQNQRHVLGEVGATGDRPDRRALEQVSRDLGTSLRQGHELLDVIRSRHLVRSPYHRQFLDRVLEALGTARLEDNVTDTLAALEDHRGAIAEVLRHEDSMLLDRRVEVLTYIALFIGIEQAVVALVDGQAGTTDLVGLAVAGVIVVLLLALKQWQSRRP